VRLEVPKYVPARKGWLILSFGFAQVVLTPFVAAGMKSVDERAAGHKNRRRFRFSTAMVGLKKTKAS
jgi:hypothetical protein